MFNLILCIVTVKYVSAVPLKFLNLPQHNVEVDIAPDCSWFKVHFANPNHTIHIPEDCMYYDFVHPIIPDCNSTVFPMNCKFALNPLPEIEKSRTESFLSVKSSGSNRKPPIPKPDLHDEESITKWATVAIAKAVLFSDEICKPATKGKNAPRHFDCDACWWGFIPYPCNCNCRGWNQVLSLCSQPCHEFGEYSYDSGAYCHKPCDQEGQCINTVGCGLGHDRVCVHDSGACVQRWVARAVDVFSVLVNVVPGAGTAMSKATTAARAALTVSKTAASRAAAYAAARQALKITAAEVKDKYKTLAFWTPAFQYLSGAKDRVIEEAVLRFYTSNMPFNREEDDDVALELAKLADPTGIIAMATSANWIPPPDCDSTALCSIDYCEGLTDPVVAPTDPCEIYGGKLHPNGISCCGLECGLYCGASDCAQGSGGSSSCCGSNFMLCGKHGQMAPCQLVVIGECGPYDGLMAEDGLSCCSKECGILCGAGNCETGTGGSSACCPAYISPDGRKDNFCGMLPHGYYDDDDDDDNDDRIVAPCQLTPKGWYWDRCTEYDGRLHHSGAFCCTEACGIHCGADNCAEGPGGSSSCCDSGIVDTNKYGSKLYCGTGYWKWTYGNRKWTVHKAPCQLRIPVDTSRQAL